jgi:DNA-binding LacI/PurR family transcriptional regulator
VNRAANRGDAFGMSAVISDDLQGITLAVTHLVGLGHQRIAYVGSTLDVSSDARRGVTFHQVARRLGLLNAVAVEGKHLMRPRVTARPRSYSTPRHDRLRS